MHPILKTSSSIWATHQLILFSLHNYWGGGGEPLTSGPSPSYDTTEYKLSQTVYTLHLNTLLVLHIPIQTEPNPVHLIAEHPTCTGCTCTVWAKLCTPCTWTPCLYWMYLYKLSQTLHTPLIHLYTLLVLDVPVQSELNCVHLTPEHLTYTGCACINWAKPCMPYTGLYTLLVLDVPV